MRRPLALVVVVAVIVLCLLKPPPALGHAALVRSEPAANAFLQRPPQEVLLVFTEPIETRSSSIRVLDAGGVELALSAQALSRDGLTLRTSLPTLKPGIYNVLWGNVSSIDGHALQGSFPFTVLNPDGSVPNVVNTVGGIGTDIDPAPLADGVAVRALSLLGLVIAAGAAVVLMLWREAMPGVRRGLANTALAGGGVLVIATLLNLAVLREAYEGVGVGDLLFHSRAGGYWLTRLGAALWITLLATFVTGAPRRSAVVILVAAGLYLWGYAATSHAAAGTGSAWATTFDLLHGLTAVLWIGAVVGVAVGARLAGRSPGYRQLVPRFSLLASILVFVLLATGALGALIEVDRSAKLTGTRYGVTLMLKVGLGVLLLAVAAYNARRGSRRLVLLLPGEPRRFLLTATVEIALGLGVFVLAAALTQTTAAKSVIKAPESKPFAQQTVVGDLSVILTIDPNRTGLNTYGVALADAAGKPIVADRVRLTFRYRQDQTIGPSTLTLAASGGEGTYSGQGPFLTLEGQWRVEVEVRRPDVDDAIAFFDVRPAGSALSVLRRRGAWSNPAPGLTWNEFGGLLVLLVGLGVALWSGRLARLGRPAAWAANGSMAVAFGVGALLLFGVHAHQPSGALPTNPIFPDANSVAAGKRLYQENCVSCHGLNGVPPKGLDLSPYPLDLTVHVPQHPDGQLFNFIAYGLPGSAMRAWGEGAGKHSDEQMWHLVNYLRTLGAVDQ